MKKYQSRFGTVDAGKITALHQEAGTINVGDEVITPTQSFWSRFSPQRVTVVPAPKAKEGEKQEADGFTQELDYSIGYYVLTEGGHDRFVYEPEFKGFVPVSQDDLEA
ncbi:hypothetical protein [Pararhizobium sp. DWP1-1-3]|uniref:hypothetical protein n=1 Tax=Pararhizobium sp. DWP1-1-3 TaxID=2804652 RepID=UPI003CF298DB